MPKTIEIKNGAVTVADTGLAPAGAGRREWSFRSLEEAIKQRPEFDADLSPAQKTELDQAAIAIAAANK